LIALACRSHYSLLRGTAAVPALCRAARQRGYSRLALTDSDNLYGLWAFLRHCRHNQLSPIVGAELTEPGSGRRAVCLVESEAGFANLCRLITRRHDGDFDLGRDLLDLGQGLLVLSDDAGLLAGWRDAGLRPAVLLSGRPSGAGLELRRLARRLGLAAAAVPDSFFLDPGDYPLHRLLRAVAGNTSLSRLSPADLAPERAWLAPAEELRRRFAAWPEALRAVEELAERLEYVPAPRTIMPPWADPRGRSAGEVLREEAFAGARRRYGGDLPGAVVERLERELALIAGKNFSAYFLIVRDIVRRSPRICGRGSGAASLVAYCLGITNVCPLKFNLYFERFLNPGRSDPPDIDVDFAWDERDGIIASVLAQHSGRSAMVCNHVLFQGRMAIRETAKVFGLPEREIKRTMKRLPWLRGPAEEGTGFYPRRQALPRGADPSLCPPPWPEVLGLAQRLVGAPRCLSVHPGGVVITPGPIEAFAPIETAAKGVPIIQWEKDGAEEAGLVKIDLLGNRSLAVIRDAAAGVRANGRPFNEAGWEPEDDPATQALVARGGSMGCFYIESPATRLLQQKAGLGDYEHLVIHSSIIRPAANDYIQEYLHRLKGGAWRPIHPLVEDILAETYGIMVYQEDVSRTAVALAGFSHAEADRLRKIMTKKDREYELADYRECFTAGCRARGVEAAVIEAVWAMMLSFDGYSFCKPHSASYARVSYQAAFLKTHHPAEFMAAVISNQGGFYSTFAYVSEARRLGLKVLPPDLNESQVRWTGRDEEIRVGLMAVGGLGQETRTRLAAERARRPFADPADFLDRVRPAEDEARALIAAGAFDSLAKGRSRAALHWELARRRNRPAGPGEGLFAGPEAPAPDLPPD